MWICMCISNFKKILEVKTFIFRDFFLTTFHFSYKIKYAIFLNKKEVHFHEDDLSAQKAFSCQSTWFQSKNEYTRREKSFSCKTCKRKKKIVCIGHRNVTFLQFFHSFLRILKWISDGTEGEISCNFRNR